jgi:hypothetical protein
MQMMDLLMIILERFDRNIYALLLRTNVGTVFALPWVITGFAHSVSDIRITKRIFDAILATHPLLCIYLSVSMLTRPHTRRRLFELAEEDDSMASIHHFLQTVPKPCMPPFSSSQMDKRGVSQEIKPSDQKKKKPPILHFFSREDRRPNSIEEEDNSADLLVEKAVAMMCIFTPQDACEEYERQKRKKFRSRESQTGSVGIPNHSVACVPLSQKAHWIDAMDHFKMSSDVYNKLMKKKKETDKLLKLMMLGFGLTTLVSVTVASKWYSETSLRR